MPKVLTAQTVEKMKAGPTRREIPDARLTGLYLVVQPSGAKSWALRYRYGGKSRKLTLGPWPPHRRRQSPEAGGRRHRGALGGQ